MLLIPTAFYGMHLFGNPDPLLNEARQLLHADSGGADSIPPQRHVRRARQVLQTYLQRSQRDSSPATLLLLMCDWYEGRPVDAPRALDRIPLDKCSTRELTVAAVAAFQVSDFPSADRLISAALERPGSDREHVLRAASVIRFDLGRHEDVLAHCRELGRLAPNDARPWMVMASVHESRSDWINVVANYREVLARTPGDKFLERQVMIGFLLKSADIKEARDEFDKLKNDWPGLSQTAPLLEARLLYQEGDAEQALPGIARALQAQPDDPEALLLQGKIRFERGEFETATTDLERLIAIEPLNHEARYVLGQVYHRSGRQSEADEMFVAYRRLSNIKSRLFDLESRAASNPQDVEARAELVRIYDQLGLQKKADAWRKVLGPADPAARESYP